MTPDAALGTKFEETREMRGRVGTTVPEATEYFENDRMRIVSDAGGTNWDSLFTMEQSRDGGTELVMGMEARPHTLPARIRTPLVEGMVAKGIEADLVAVKPLRVGLSP